MLTFSRLGKVGRLGNQLFQVAFITSFAERHKIKYALPYWRYAEFFEYEFEFRDDLHTLEYNLIVKEPSLGYHEDYFASLLPTITDSNVNIITGYFQSYKYFEKHFIRKVFTPKVKMSLNLKNCVAISVRRGDFVRHKDYNNIEAEVYRQLLLKQFKNFKVFVFTDDFQYCRNEFIGGQFEFMEGLNDIGQLQVMSKFEHFILSNSTFSYWGPMLSHNPKIVLYPKYMFPDLDRCDLYNREYWPPHKSYIMYENEINKK